MADKIYVSEIDEMERLLEEGVASISDWKEFIDWYFGRSMNSTDENGFYVYPNVDSVVASAAWISEFEEFHYCSEHDCKTHGNWSEGALGGDGPQGGYFSPLKGRSISPGQRVKVYRNLHKEGVVYSVADAKTGLVLGHTPSIILKNVKYEVHEAGRQRVIREKKKNVHSFVTGEYAGPFSEQDRRDVLSNPGREPISYNPYKSGSYYSKKDDRPVAGASMTIVDQTGVYQIETDEKDDRFGSKLASFHSIGPAVDIGGKLTWRERLASFHLAGQHDQSSHGSWAGDSVEPEPATSRYGTSPDKIRRWAIREGKAVGERGRLPADIVNEYDDTFGPGDRPTDSKPQPQRTPTMDKIHRLAEEANELLTHGSTYMAGWERNKDREAARRRLAVEAEPALARFGDSLVLRDMSWDPSSVQHVGAVSQHIQDLAAIPDHLVSQFVGAGGSVIVGNGPITAIGGEGLQRLSGVQPRGWPAGTTYDDVAGVYSPSDGAVILGNIANRRNTPVSNFAFHEFGHGLDALTKKVSLLSSEDRFTELHSEFKSVARGAGYLNNYYVQQGNPGAGASEFFADATRAWMKAQVRAGNGFPEDRNAVVRNSFAEAGTFVSADVADRILSHFDSQYAVGGARFEEPAAAVKAPARASSRKPRSDAGKKRSTRNVTFLEESKARSMRRRGLTLEEISDELKISVGTLSKLLGG